MILVDTGYLLANLLVADELHRRAIAWGDRVQDEKLLITEYVLLEALNELSKPVRRKLGIFLADEVRTASIYEFVSASPSLFDGGSIYFDNERTRRGR